MEQSKNGTCEFDIYIWFQCHPIQLLWTEQTIFNAVNTRP